MGPYTKGGDGSMNHVFRNVMAVVIGLAVGTIVNMGFVNIGPSVIPLPEGADVSTTENMRASMQLFTPANFLFPFLGHAVGTLAGAFAAAKLAASQSMKLALGVGVFFLMGGITAVFMFQGPMWFNVVDLLVAYIPMGFLGGVLGGRRSAQG